MAIVLGVNQNLIVGDLTITGDLTVEGSATIEVDETVLGNLDVQGCIIVDVDKAEALLIRADGDGGDVFAVNTLTNQTLFALGTAAAPAITFGGNLSTGIYSLNTNNISIAVNGNSLLAVTRSGVPVERVQLGSGTILTWVSGAADVGGPQFGLARNAADHGLGAGVGDLELIATHFSIYNTRVSSTSYDRTSIRFRTETLSSVSGASVTTSGSIIPNGAIMLGVTTTITDGLGTGNGTTGYEVGDGSDIDRWGSKIGTAAGVFTDNEDFTNSALEIFTSANEVTITALGGNFDGTGDILVTVHYIEIGARR